MSVQSKTESSATPYLRKLSYWFLVFTLGPVTMWLNQAGMAGLTTSHMRRSTRRV